jgi:hypothetical protein
MDRAELERLDREGLVHRAQAAGVRRARLLTRPELVDELLRLDTAIDPSQLKKTRGLFGRARDLLSRVVERGLHLPDAADRLRAALGTAPLAYVPRPEPQAVPTVTLAEIYAAQGHKRHAIDTLRRVLEAEPEHAGARALLEKLEAADYVPPAPVLPPEGDDTARDEIGGNLVAAHPATGDQAPETVTPETAEAPPSREEPPTLRFSATDEVLTLLAADECVAIPLPGGVGSPSAGPQGQRGSYVWWRLSASSRRRIGSGSLVVRALVFRPTWNGPDLDTRDVISDPDTCEHVIGDLPSGAVVRVAVGTSVEGTFVPLAHSPAIELAPARQGGLVQRTIEGVRPIDLDDPLAASVAVAAGRAARIAEQGR